VDLSESPNQALKIRGDRLDASNADFHPLLSSLHRPFAAKATNVQVWNLS
jgi:hypothetical protein